jgi:Ca2+-binding RTX toxin-like protein
MIHGTNASETIDAADGVTEGDDAIWGHMGDDTIFGLGGNDAILGGIGADYMDGGAGIDLADYSTSIGAVRVSLALGAGSWGDAEGDTLIGIENLTGSDYDDILVGDGGSNALDGWFGNDVLKGGGGSDRLQGGAGHDILKGGGGADRLDGNIGTDTVAYNESNEGVSVSLMSGTGSGGDAHGDVLIAIENLAGSEYDDRLWGNDETNELRGLGGDDWLKGYGGSDTLLGGNGQDNLNGGDGNDALRGEAGNDNISGGAGADTMVGGFGSDTYAVDHWWDIVTESGGQGIDVVRTSVSYALTAGSDVEVLEASHQAGTGALVLLGNANGNIVRGNNGNNVIGGGNGNDELTGFGGQDSFLFSTALDETYNVDIITDFNVADDTIRLDDAVFSSGLGLGNIGSGEFVIGTAALDANDRIIYNSSTGALYYDSDANGSAAAIRFAVLSPGLAITSDDFYIV